MRILILILYLFVQSNLIFAEKYNSTPGFGLYLLGGGSYWNSKWESWDKFASTYNQGFGNHLNQTLTPFQPHKGYFFGAGFRFAIFGVEYSRYKYPDQTLAMIFKNGDQQIFQLKTNGYNMNFPIVYPVSKSFALGIDMGVKSMNGELHSHTVYKDGTKSYGPEHTINGIFEFNKRWLIQIGPRIEIGRRIKLFASATWNLMDSGDVTGLQDLGSDYGDVWTGQLRTVYLPEEFSNRKNDSYYFVGYGPLLRVVKGMKADVGLIFNIHNFKIF